MEIHILNGDALAEKFSLQGEIVVCREAMIDGPVNAETEESFWRDRAKFIAGEFNKSIEEYHLLVVDELNRIKQSKANTFTLWFEHDLFCQTNLWFVIDFIARHRKSAQIFNVMPDPSNDLNWSGFGKMNSSDLVLCYHNRTLLSNDEKLLAVSLWDAYRKDDLKKLKQLSTTASSCFPKLVEVCQAHLDRNSAIQRPQRKLKSILAKGTTDFSEIFDQFRETEAIYGFGDLQVKKLLSEISS
ncbi:MAG TPA: hypothetical protein VGD65_10760 [Chryseosolibacter sp.]